MDQICISHSKLNRFHVRNTKNGHKSANPAVINNYFNSKRKLSTDSVMKDKVKSFKKDKEKIILNKVKTFKETCTGKISCNRCSEIRSQNR